MQGCPKDQENFPFVVLGNKLDRAADRKIQDTRAQQWCKNHGNIQYFETSAKDATNVELAFQAIAKAAATSDKDEEIFLPTTVQLSNPDKKKTAKKDTGCC